MTMTKTIYFESLGCARNLVDSQKMQGRLENAGWQLTGDPAKAGVIVVNTCSFIESAVNESIDTILALSAFKNHGACRRLVVAGCLPERYREKIASALPEVDAFIGTGAFDRIIDAAEGRLTPSACLLPDPQRIADDTQSLRKRSETPAVYLKIAEGCSRQCTYCIIPTLRGRQKSRPSDDILAEARVLLQQGARELVLVSQDTTAYGRDLLPACALSDLLAQLARLPEASKAWIRFLYGHPESIDAKVIETVAAHGNLCPYFDIPIQHASAGILKKMGRHYTAKDLRELFHSIRSAIPHAALRTTAIVGFPGETEDDFDELLNFVDEIRFDHLGVFIYSDALDLPSHGLPHPVAKRTANRRHDRLMAHQQEISRQIQKKWIGQSLTVLLEEQQEENLLAGRSMFQAPEVDGLVWVRTGHRSQQVSIGSFSKVRIIDAWEYDLMGEAQ
jgi:ribosomal protein S12 methylthiotransferase